MDPLLDLLLDTRTRKRYRIFFNNEEMSKLSNIILEDDTLESIFGKLLIVLNGTSDADSEATRESIYDLHNKNICMLYKNSETSYDLLGVSRNLPFPLTYMNNPLEDSYDHNILNSIHGIKLEAEPLNEQKKILDDYNILDNTILIFSLKYIMDNKTVDVDDSKQTNGYIRKYWPFIDDETIKELHEGKQLSKHKEYIDKELLKHEKELNDQIQISQNIDGIKSISELPTDFTFYHLCLQKDLKVDIDIKLLFNNITLSNDIPVTILNLESYSDSRYKIFKKATKDISVQQFKQWKSGIVLVPHLFESSSYYNSRTNCVSFCLNISNGMGNINKNAMLNISANGVIELITEKNTMKAVSLKPDSQTNINLETLIERVNVVLEKCKYYNDDISYFDANFLTNKDSETVIKELGGKIHYIINVSCDQEREPFDILLQKTIDQYKTYIRVREEEIPINRKKDRDTLLSSGQAFVYKRISEYTSLNSLEAMVMPFIINIKSEHQQAPVIKYVLKALYNDNTKFEKDAKKLVVDTIKKYQAKNNIKRKRIERGISCRIEDVGQQIHVYFDSVKNFSELQRLTQFVTIMIHRTLNNKNLKDDIFKLYTKKEKQERKSSSSSSSKAEISSRIEKPEIPDESGSERPTESERDTRDTGVADASDSDSSSSSSSSSIQSVGGGKILLKQYHEKRIRMYDPELTKWKGQGQKSGISRYANKCIGDKRQNKQPYIIPDIQEIKRIEDLWRVYFKIPTAFGKDYDPPRTPTESMPHPPKRAIDDKGAWRNSDEEDLDKQKDFGDDYIRWIKASSGNPEQVAFYICNRYWCVNCSAPIPDRHFKDVYADSDTGDSDTKDEDARAKTYQERKKNKKLVCPFCKCGYFGAKDDGGIKELNPKIHGTILERVEPYWSQKKGKLDSSKPFEVAKNNVKYFPGYIENEEIYKESHIKRPGEEYLEGRIPCCFKGEAAAVLHDPRKHAPEGSKKQTVKGKALIEIYNDAAERKGRIGSNWGKICKRGGLCDLEPKIEEIINPTGDKTVVRYGVRIYSEDVQIKDKSGTDKWTRNKVDLLNSLAIVYFNNIFRGDKTDEEPANALIAALKQHKVDLRFFCKANNGDLISKFKTPYDKLELVEKEEIIKWIPTCSRNFTRFYKLYKSTIKSLTIDTFNKTLKETPEFRVLCNIWTAYNNFLTQIYKLDYDNILPVIQELEHQQAATTDPERRIDDGRPTAVGERYICLFHISVAVGSKKPKINIVYPGRFFKDKPEYISYIIKQNETYQPVLDIENGETATIKLNEDLFRWCSEEHEKDTFNTATLPVIDYETLNNIPLLQKISQKKKFADKYYYVDSLSIARNIILNLSANDDFSDPKSVILPITPYKILDLDGNIETGTEKHVGEGISYPLTSLYHIKKGNAFNKYFNNIPTYIELKIIIDRINDSGVFRKNSNARLPGAYNIDGLFVDITRNKAVGYSVNGGHIVYFVEIDDPQQIEELKDLKQYSYINDEEVEKDVFVGEINKSEKKEVDIRKEYQQKAINETLLYKQYTLEISSAITQEDSIMLKKLADIDLSMDDIEKYLYKSMWQQDKRDKIRDLILKKTTNHTKEGKINPFDAYPEDDRQIQSKCNRRVYKKSCNKRPLCKYSGKTCKLILGGKSYWSERSLKDLFVEMLTDDIYYGGLKAVKILNKEIKSVDSRLSSIYKSSDKELILTPLDINDEELLKIFKYELDPNEKSAYTYSGGKRRTLKKKKQRRRTIRKKKQLRTHKKKKQTRTHKRNRKRRTKK